MAEGLLKPIQRAAIERYLLSDSVDADPTETFRAVREFNRSIGVYSASLEFLRWLLAADDTLRAAVAARAEGVREGYERSEARHAAARARGCSEDAPNCADDGSCPCMGIAAATGATGTTTGGATDGQ